MQINVKTVIFMALSLAVLLTGCGDSEVGYKALPEGLSSVPYDGAKRVSVLTDIKIISSAGLDSSTVNSSTVILSYNQEVRGTVTYDDRTQSIIFTPFRPLYYGTRYILDLSGIKDMDGNTLPEIISGMLNMTVKGLTAYGLPVTIR
jgi:hypothetical protein